MLIQLNDKLKYWFHYNVIPHEEHNLFSLVTYIPHIDHKINSLFEWVDYGVNKISDGTKKNVHWNW